MRRWIGARRRRAARAGPDGDATGAEIITLTWTQTFGREASPAHRPRGACRAVDPGEERQGS